MKTITTHNNKELLCIEIPDDFTYNIFNILDARNDVLWGNSQGKTITIPLDYLVLSIPYDGEKPKVIGALKDLKDEDVESYIEKHGNLNYKDYSPYVPFTSPTYHYTAKESFISLLESKGVDVSKNILIIEKQ